ncbi:MAG TPA: hypothetical protein ENG42_00105 [Candidatus Aenigmarchaeota archaeon]|nr:MAG: hypothetical protein DRP03_00460 [Candidatus Aenigmarchaeota archaeon]HDD45853.1 hypothetical protein [Candidatus Aenigmarchaeota archaeon]
MDNRDIGHYSMGKIIMDMLPIITLLLIVSTISGYFLNKNLGMPVFVSLLVVVPSFINMTGDIASVIGSRISSGLHLGKIVIGKRQKLIYHNLMAALIIAFITFFILGICAETLLIFLNGKGIGYVTFILITLSAGITTTFILSIFVIITALLSYKYGIDPDNTTSPIITTLGDLIGVINLFMFAKIIIGG